MAPPTLPYSISENSYGRIVLALVLVLTAIKIVVAANAPIAFDEALYWRYSKHLAPGFIDHPFANPLLIRLGTILLGDTPLGVRIAGILLCLPATWAVWRTALALFANKALAVTAALYFNLTVVCSIGTMVATSDEVVVVTSCFLLLFLAKLSETGDGRWWLAAGVAFGLGLCSKYTTAFFAVSIVTWLALSPSLRRWFLSPWAWAGGAIALLIFSPVLLWNAQHQWASLIYQFGRLTVYQFTAQYEFELFGAMLLLATPPILILAGIGLYRLIRSKYLSSASILLTAFIAPMLVYFFWHASHERVQGNWIEPVFPGLCQVAAYATAYTSPSNTMLSALTAWSRRLAFPFALGLAALAYLEADTGFIHLSHDPRAKVLGVGWAQLAPELEATRLREDAKVILTTDYTLNSWLKFYLPPATPVEQVDERMRWSNEPAPNADLFKGNTLYLCKEPCWKVHDITSRYRVVNLVSRPARVDHGHVIAQYRLYKASELVGSPLDDLSKLSRADHTD